MKKLTKAILAATLLAVGMPAVAANVDQANGTASDGTYSWEYWKDNLTAVRQPPWRTAFSYPYWERGERKAEREGRRGKS